MRLLKIYCLLYIPSVLLLQPVWAGAKYIVPILPFIIIFIIRGITMAFWRQGKVRSCATRHRRNQTTIRNVGCRIRDTAIGMGWGIPLVILLLSLNAIYIGEQSFRQITNNIDYLKGDRYAGYPPEVRQYFEQLERLRGLPDSTVVVARKPEFVYLISGKKAIYPWQMEK